MKKFISIILVIFACLTLTSCGSKEGEKVFRVEFESNPSTGYSWSYSFSESGIVKNTKSEFISGNNEDGATGVPGTQVYEFEAEKEGEVVVTFVYSRSWEEDGDNTTKEYKLKVDKDLNITQEK